MPKAPMQSTRNSFWSSWIKIKHDFPKKMKDTITNTSSNICGYSFDGLPKHPIGSRDETTPSDQPINQQLNSPPPGRTDRWLDPSNQQWSSGSSGAPPGIEMIKKHHMKEKNYPNFDPKCIKSQGIAKNNLSTYEFWNISSGMLITFSHDSHRDQPTADQSLDQIFSAQG